MFSGFQKKKRKQKKTKIIIDTVTRNICVKSKGLGLRTRRAIYQLCSYGPETSKDKKGKSKAKTRTNKEKTGARSDKTGSQRRIKQGPAWSK